MTFPPFPFTLFILEPEVIDITECEVQERGKKDAERLVPSTPLSEKVTTSTSANSDVLVTEIKCTGRPRIAPQGLLAGRSAKRKRSQELQDQATDYSPKIDKVVVNLLDAEANQRRIIHASLPQKASNRVDRSTVEETDAEASKPDGINISCGVCLDKIRLPASTDCGHVFCYDCISRVQKTLKQCPICRKSLMARQYRKLYI